MARAGRPKRGPDKPSNAELELFQELHRLGGLEARLAAEVARIQGEARSWSEPVDLDLQRPTSRDVAAWWLRHAADLCVEAKEDPHPYIKVTFTHRPTMHRLAYPVPLVDSYGDPLDGPLMELQEVLDTEDLGANDRLSYPDADGYRWLHL